MAGPVTTVKGEPTTTLTEQKIKRLEPPGEIWGEVGTGQWQPTGRYRPAYGEAKEAVSFVHYAYRLNGGEISQRGMGDTRTNAPWQELRQWDADAAKVEKTNALVDAKGSVSGVHQLYGGTTKPSERRRNEVSGGGIRRVGWVPRAQPSTDLGGTDPHRTLHAVISHLRPKRIDPREPQKASARELVTYSAPFLWAALTFLR